MLFRVRTDSYEVNLIKITLEKNKRVKWTVSYTRQLEQDSIAKLDNNSNQNRYKRRNQWNLDCLCGTFKRYNYVI